MTGEAFAWYDLDPGKALLCFPSIVTRDAYVVSNCAARVACDNPIEGALWRWKALVTGIPPGFGLEVLTLPTGAPVTFMEGRNTA